MTSRSKAVRATGIALVGLSVLCGASTTAAASPAQPASVQRFEAQARTAGLSAGQAASLQQKVDTYLATVGGTQVAPNRIQLVGATVYVAAPGEEHPRDLTGATEAMIDPCAGRSAEPKHMCAYRSTGFTGDEVDMYACGRYYFSTWSGPGSWDNNQSTGTVARMYGPSGAWVYSTKPAHSWDSNGNWTPVHSIVNC